MRQRFAPSPTGLLHLGHAFSALTIWRMTEAAGGEFLLRIEDIDGARARPEYISTIFEDLHWLGLDWPLPVWIQSARMAHYEMALNTLIKKGLCYPCQCSRSDIFAALSAPQENVITNLPQPYPGTCRQRPMADRIGGDAIRLDMARAIASLGGEAALQRLEFVETGPRFHGQHTLACASLLARHGDIVLARRDIGTSYHLAVVVDDAAQAITHVTRGEDMFDSTEIHRLLQALLGLPTPVYHHHRLVRDAAGRRLAKRDDARAIARFRADGATPADIWRLCLDGLG